MKYVYSFLILVICALGIFAELGEKVSTQPSYGTAFDEVVVDTSLNVMKRKLTRGARGGPETDPVVEHIRQKRQRPHRPGFGAFPARPVSPSFGASAANAQAQGFQSQGPLGGFGASAANTQTQGFQAGPDGIRGSAGLSGSQTYNLPNGQNLNIAYTDGISFGPDGKPAVAQGSSVTFTG